MYRDYYREPLPNPEAPVNKEQLLFKLGPQVPTDTKW